MTGRRTSNSAVAAMLVQIADLLEAQGENPFRVKSYRTAANAVRASRTPVARLVHAKQGEGVTKLSGVGPRLAGLIEEFVTTGSTTLLSSLEKEVPPSVRLSFASTHPPPSQPEKPLLDVATILAIDAEYRSKAAAGSLRRIAPRQLNPERKAWLPLLATTRSGWKFTVMFSNTATAHKLAKTNDWVVVYYERGGREQQCTVVTEMRGELKGKRVIRGREGESARYYAKKKE